MENIIRLEDVVNVQEYDFFFFFFFERMITPTECQRTVPRKTPGV